MDQNKAEAGKFTPTPEVKLHFLDYWRIIRIRKTVILAVFLLVAITTTLVTFILPEAYLSTARIQVDKDTPDVSGVTERFTYIQPYDPYWIQTEFEKIQSKSVLYKVIENLKLNQVWARKYKDTGTLQPDVTLLILKSMLDIRQSRNTSLIEIRVVSEKAGEAAQIANEIAKVYAEVRLMKRREITERGLGILKAQLEQQHVKVTNQQELVSKLKDELKITDVEAQASYSSATLEPETLRRLESERISSSARLATLDTLYREMTNLTRSELKQAITVNVPDAQLTQLLDQEATAQQKLAEMLSTYSAEHPEVIRVAKVLSAVTNQVSERISGFLSGLRSKVAAERAAVEDLKKQVQEAQALDIKRGNERRPYYLAKRDLETLQMLRDKLQMQIIAQEIESQIPKSQIVDIIDRAEPGLRPVRPNKTLNIALGVIVGLIIGVGLAFFIEYLDTSVKTIDDVERALQAPVLGVIPQNVGLLHEEGPDSPHAEAYRVLRTNVLFSRKDPKFNTITVISGGAGEGKSTTLFNLATVFAQNGQRVLVVDSDLRRPSLHKFLRLSNTIGLTSYLLKQNTLEESIQTTKIPTLDFLPSGKLPSSSLGILSSNQMKDLIRDLKRRYDYVFFDSPPIMGVSDASVLASAVDIVLQVIQYRRYPQPMTIRAKQMVEKIGGNLLGVVLNNINLAQDENYYYYSGYYYDYYSHSYDEYGSYKSHDKDEKAPADASGQAAPADKGDKVEIKSKY